MPDREVETTRDLIYYQYSKIIARRAFSKGDGKSTKKAHYGFIKKTFRELKAGKKSWSDIIREDWQLVDSEKECIYCGATADLHKDHIVPKSLTINERCCTCDTIQGIHNQVWACRDCNLKKGTKGLYGFYRELHPGEKKFFDFIPTLLEKKYLKTICACHECAGTLDLFDANGDGEISVLDIDYVVHAYT